MSTTRHNIQSAAIGAGTALVAFAALSFSQYQPASREECCTTLGMKMQDGAIAAGISPDTARMMYATPKDAPLTLSFHEAHAYCAELDAHGRKDWRVPTRAELNVLFQNRAAIGGFSTSDSYPAGWYWSSSRNFIYAWVQSFSDGIQNSNGYSLDASVLRCVRG